MLLQKDLRKTTEQTATAMTGELPLESRGTMRSGY